MQISIGELFEEGKFDYDEEKIIIVYRAMSKRKQQMLSI